MVFHTTNENVNGWLPRMSVKIDTEEVRKCKNVQEFQCAVNAWMKLLGLKTGNLEWVTPSLLCALKMWIPVGEGHFLMGIRAYNPYCMSYEIVYKPHNNDNRVYPVLMDEYVSFPKLEITVLASENSD